jgi:hypothetical protein
MSNALVAFKASLVHADNLIEGTKTGRGRPSGKEASMFVASVALAYAAWEAYVEDVAVEVSSFLADHADAAMVPSSVRLEIEKQSPTAWELTVHPGWKELWKARVQAQAKGDPDAGKFGMNTARIKQVIILFKSVGLDFVSVIDPRDRSALEELVTARGAVVHSANTPVDFNKGVAKGYRDLVERVTKAVDESLRLQAEDLVGKSPWIKV